MKFVSRSLVGAAVLMALGSAANALTVAEYGSATKIYFGGATATDNVLEETFISQVSAICDPTFASAVTIYRAANQRVITCKVSAENNPVSAGVNQFATRAAGGTMIAFHKESAGGSSNGVVPLINWSVPAPGTPSHSLSWMNVTTSTTGCTTTTVAATANLMGYTNVVCTLSATPAGTPVHGGISDTEPALSFPAPASTETARLDSPGGLGIVFGVPVTKVLYRALQKSQFGNGSACDGSDLPTCVPSLTRSQVRALYSQTIADWDSFTNAAGSSLTQIAGVTAPADTSVRVCRRVASSGTQASYESYWLNQRCVNGVPGFALPDDSSSVLDTVYSPSDFGNALVNAAPSSGNVRACLQAANTGNYWGVGVLSTEVTASNLSGAGDSFRMVAIDGATPTLANVANGDYDFFTENTINTIKSGQVNALPTGVVKQVIDNVKSKIGNTAVLANLNATFAGRPWGNGGVLALSNVNGTGISPYTDGEMTLSPVNTQTRGGNNCAPPAMRKPSPVNGTPNP